MKVITSIILGACITTAFAACKGSSNTSHSDTVKDTTLVKDSANKAPDSAMGKAADTAKKTISAPAAAGPKGHVDSVTKK